MFDMTVWLAELHLSLLGALLQEPQDLNLKCFFFRLFQEENTDQ